VTQLRDLIAKLRLDTTAFNAGLAGAKGQASGLAGHMRAVLLPVAGALAGAFSAQALWQGVLQGAQEIDAVAKSARAVGGSIGGFRALELAASESGVAVETLREQAQNMDRQIAAGRADVALRALGLEADKLRSMDIDQRFAAIADSMQGLGLDTGQAQALLQQFGIENRNMSLLMIQGGDALRAARKDVDDYGLALSRVDAAAVEKANDQFGRLAIVGQYLRQELAIGVMPVLGQLAQRFTDSLRPGGLLRETIDDITGAIGNLVTVIGGLANGLLALGGWIWGVATAFRDWLFAIDVIGPALERVLSPLTTTLDLLASVFRWISDLITATGGFGEAMGAMGAVAVEVWQRIKLGAEGMGRAMSGVASLVQGAFMTAFGAIGRKFAELTQKVAEGVNKMFAKAGIDIGLTGMDSSGFAGMEDAGREETAVGGRQLSAAGTFFKEASGPLKSVQALKDLVAEYRKSKETGDEATESAIRFNSALDGLGGGAGGGGGGGKGSADEASRAMKNLTDRVREMQGAMNQVKSTLGNAFVGLITGAKSLRQALGEVLGEFAKMLANRAFNALWSNSGMGNIFGSLLGLGGGGGGGGGKWWLGGRSFDGGGFTGMGARLGGLDGKGGFPAILHPNETVIDHSRGGMAMSLTVYTDDSVIVRASEGAALRVVRNTVPGMITRGLGTARERDLI
jgi:hypothetical protein